VALILAIVLALVVLPRPWGWVAIGVAAVYEAVSTWIGWNWSRSRQPVVGPAALVGELADVIDDCRPDGHVRIRGELWQARCAAGADAGAQVRVRAVRALVLDVEPV